MDKKPTNPTEECPNLHPINMEKGKLAKDPQGLSLIPRHMAYEVTLRCIFTISVYFVW